MTVGDPIRDQASTSGGLRLPVLLGATGMAAASLGLFIAGAVRAVSARGPIWFEGPVAGFMVSIRAGRLYQASALRQPPYSVLTHTPLSYWIDYGIDRRFHDLNHLRLLNVFITLLCAALIGWMVRLATTERGPARWLGAVFGAALFLSCTPVFFWSQVARSADAFSCLFSLSCMALLVGKAPSRGREAAVGVLLALAILSKQTELATLAPVVIGDAIVRERRPWAALGRAALAAALVASICLWLQWRTHGGFYANVVGGNTVRMQLAWWAAINARLLAWWVFAVGVLSAGRIGKSTVFVWLLFCVAFGLLGTAKRGSDIMYFFDASAALAILAGTGLTTLSGSSRVILVAAVVPGFLLMLTQDLQRMTSISAASGQDYARLIHWLQEGPAAGGHSILSDDAAIAVALGQTPVWDDPFVFTEWVEMGRASDTTVEMDVRQHRYAAIVVTDPELLWPGSLRRVVAQNYRLAAVFPGTLPAPRCVYVPRTLIRIATPEDGKNPDEGTEAPPLSCTLETH